MVAPITPVVPVAEKKFEISEKDKHLCHYFVMTNRFAFRERYMGIATGRFYKTRFYQVPPCLVDDCVVLGGRSIGKSYDLEISIVQTMLNNPAEESLLTAFRRTHVKDREERVITYLAQVQYFSLFFKGTNRSVRDSVSRTPIYRIALRNQHVHCGISVGDDPAAVMIQGHHPCIYPTEKVLMSDGRYLKIHKIIQHFEMKRKNKLFVKAYDRTTKSIVNKEILNAFKNPLENRKILELVSVNGHRCLVTDNHVMYVYNVDLSNIVRVMAGRIDPAKHFLVVRDENEGVTFIRVKSITEKVPLNDYVCDLEVEGLHNFFVGEDSAILVSNCHRFGEEFQFFPDSAWQKFQSTQDPKGSIDRYYGTKDGRQDTPYRKLDGLISKFKNFRFSIPQVAEPFFNQEKKIGAMESLGGVTSNEFLQQILAQWGEPLWGVWDEKAISDCLNKTEDPSYPGLLLNKLKVIELTGKTYKNLTPAQALHELPPLPESSSDVILGIDTGYTSPTVILPFFYLNGHWNLRCRVMLKDKIIAENQAELIDYIADFYRANVLSVDCTSSEGKAPADVLCNTKNIQYASKNYAKRLLWVEFTKKMIISYKTDGTEVEDSVKNATTQILYTMFSKREFDIYYDEDIMSDFNSEVKRQSPTGFSIVTPSNVHIPEAFRCFAYGYFMTKIGAQKPKPTQEKSVFALPEFSGSVPLFGRGFGRG